jgi:ubiquinone/menaquinone biosynthesis C-methylase UbiE
VKWLGKAMSLQAAAQSKAKEIAFFDRHAADRDYDVFTPASSQLLIDTFVRLTGLAPGARVADLGCGSGAFGALLAEAGYKVAGVDISPALIKRAQAAHPGIEFKVGDVEHLPFEAECFDGVMLSGIVHHLPDPTRCAEETFRILRKGGRFMAFDPNRMNPFMYLYRDRSSPFYSSVGVTENERPILAKEVATTFLRTGLLVETEFLSGLSYRYVASGLARAFLPIYNIIDRYAFSPQFLRKFRSFVITSGEK